MVPTQCYKLHKTEYNVLYIVKCAYAMFRTLVIEIIDIDQVHNDVNMLCLQSRGVLASL